MEDIATIRKVKSFGGGGIKEECLVIFKDVERRDFVYSHARNLANQKADPMRRANLRMHIPSHLLECFRTLDKHGHILKQRYEKMGKKLKRHVNYDDETESLYLDVKVSKDDPWERVYPEFAREERRKREKKIAHRRVDRLSSIVESSDDDFDDDRGPSTFSSSRRFPGPRPR